MERRRCLPILLVFFLVFWKGPVEGPKLYSKSYGNGQRHVVVLVSLTNWPRNAICIVYSHHIYSTTGLASQSKFVTMWSLGSVKLVHSHWGRNWAFQIWWCKNLVTWWLVAKGMCWCQWLVFYNRAPYAAFEWAFSILYTHNDPKVRMEIHLYIQMLIMSWLVNKKHTIVWSSFWERPCSFPLLPSQLQDARENCSKWIVLCQITHKCPNFIQNSLFWGLTSSS